MGGVMDVEVLVDQCEAAARDGDELACCRLLRRYGYGAWPAAVIAVLWTDEPEEAAAAVRMQAKRMRRIRRCDDV